jgi:CheY-like chemotaxis protein
MSKLKSVLLVDDDDTANFINQLLLTRLQVAEQLQVVTNGQEALNTLSVAAEADGPALVLLDLNMPVMNGLEFLEQYQYLPAAVRSATVVVVLTISEFQLDLARLRQYSVQDVLLKPLTEGKVTALLSQHFELA